MTFRNSSVCFFLRKNDKTCFLLWKWKLCDSILPNTSYGAVHIISSVQSVQEKQESNSNMERTMLLKVLLNINLKIILLET